MIDYEFIAYWIMWDGSKAGKGLYLQTQSITKQECAFIISVLNYKFDLICSIHMQRNQPTIYINKFSIEILKPKILPFFLPSM